jgi:hypothetical protein
MGTVRHRLSGSKIALASRCLHWARPDVPSSVDNDTPGRRIGSALHELAERHPNVEIVDVATKWNLRAAEREKVEELYASWREWWPTYIDGRAFDVEVPFAWSTEAGRAHVLQRSSHRDYSACAWDWVPMTIDAVIQGDVLEILDLKTSYDIISAEEHAQLEACGMCAAYHYGVDEVRLTIANVGTDGVRTNSSTIGGFDFDAIAGRLSRMVQGIPTAQPQPGGHCAEMWCPSLGTCSATLIDAAALVRLRPELGALASVDITTDEQAYRIKSALKPAAAFLKELEAKVVAYADERGGIRTPEGGMLKRVQVTKRSVDAGNARLRAKVATMLGAGAADVIKTKQTVSMGAFRRAVRAKAARGQKEKAERDAMMELETTGGVRLSSYMKWSDESESEDE